jgi:hypothetical protein
VNQIPSNYLLEKFYTYAGAPSYNKFTKVYCGSCPVCREGKSWLKKKRLFFYPTTNSFYCFNCTKSWNSYTWLYAVTGMTKEEIHAEVRSGDSSRDISQEINKKKTFNRQSMLLPHDSINLNELQQRSYYGSNVYVKAALGYIERRKLNTAVNRNPAYYISLTDNFHSNRLCIPYYDTDKKIVFYQTRSLDGTEPRYLNKVGCDKTLFGIERIDPNLDYIFLFEGPIDAMMVKNGVAVAGLTLTESQKRQLAQFPFHQKIWVLDNPKMDKAASDNTKKITIEGEKVFRWLDKPYKDFNEWAVAENLNEIDYNIIIENLY